MLLLDDRRDAQNRNTAAGTAAARSTLSKHWGLEVCTNSTLFAANANATAAVLIAQIQVPLVQPIEWRRAE